MWFGSDLCLFHFFCECSSIIDPLWWLPAGQFLPTSHSSSCPPCRRCIFESSRLKALQQLRFDPALTQADWSFFSSYFIIISVRLCPAEGRDEKAEVGHTAMQHPPFDRWWATHRWHHREPTNQSNFSGRRPTDWVIVVLAEKLKMSEYTSFLWDRYFY